MATRANKPISVTLGPLAKFAEERVESGYYASVSEVVRAGLRALEREEAEFDAILKRKVEEAMADPRPSLSMEEVRAAMELHRKNHPQRDA
jgi:antitoxin ParD1/3/4